MAAGVFFCLRLRSHQNLVFDKPFEVIILNNYMFAIVQFLLPCKIKSIIYQTCSISGFENLRDNR